MEVEKNWKVVGLIDRGLKEAMEQKEVDLGFAHSCTP
jgi:hypothetical protein